MEGVHEAGWFSRREKSETKPEPQEEETTEYETLDTSPNGLSSTVRSTRRRQDGTIISQHNTTVYHLGRLLELSEKSDT